MRIKTYGCSRFAGLKDVELEFTEGLNVLLGPNESGKSTVVEGIFSTLFTDIKLKQSSRAGRDFFFRFLPRPAGDYIDGVLILETEGGDYRLSKKWGSSEGAELKTPKGTILRNGKDINEELAKILLFGEGTYSNLVFAKQREIKSALSNILESEEVTRVAGDVLRMALMELSGISIDEIQRRLEGELEDVFRRWDEEKNYPENNKGISNPYKNALGKVIESYYKKEELKVLMDSAEKAEKNFEYISGELKAHEEKLIEIEEEKTALEKVESSVNSRQIINLKIQKIEGELTGLFEANGNWPKVEMEVAGANEKLQKLREEKQNLNEQLRKTKKAREAQTLIRKLEKVKALDMKLHERKEKLTQIPNVTRDDIEGLSKIQREMQGFEAAMRGGKLRGKIKSSGGKPLFITKDLEDKKEAQGTEFEAGAFIRIEYGDELEIEIQAADLDMEKLKEDYHVAKDSLAHALLKLQVESIEAGRLAQEKAKEINGEIAMLKRERELVLGGTTLDEMKEQIAEAGDISQIASAEEIETELGKVQEQELEIMSSVKAGEDKLLQWKDKFKDKNQLLDFLTDKKIDKREQEKALAELKPLPEGFATEEEFKDRLGWLKDEAREKRAKLEDLKSAYFEAKSLLPEETFEEYKAQYLQAETEFEKQREKGKKLRLIERVFHETKERLGQNPMEPLEAEFFRLLGAVTSGRYQKGKVGENFNIKLESREGEIPVELLSAGTYDSVVLALRFSMFKSIFGDNKSCLIMDDCLVDLDPERKIEAVSIIKEFAKDHQIIYTTCDPNTAGMLSSNVINL